MLVGERMTRPAITIGPEVPVPEALALMKKERIRRLPVVERGKLVGIVSDKDLYNASPSPATTLSIWEISSLLGKLAVREIMTRQVITIAEDTPLEQAARIMVDSKIGGLPVLRDGHVVGIITETDLFKIFLELLGAREAGVRVTLLLQERKGELARLTRAIYEAGGNIVALGTFTGEDPSNRGVTVKVAEVPRDALVEAIRPVALKILDVREGGVSD